MHRSLPKSDSASPYIHSIDLLRGYAALLVCLFHLTAGQPVENPQLSAFFSWGGRDGVCLFFIISGFVIPFALFNGGYALHVFPRFIVKRIVRLEPPYFVSIAAAAVLWWRFQFAAGGPSPLNFAPTTLALHLGYLIDVARSFGAAVEWYVLVYWSRAYELQYYIYVALLFPIIASRFASVRVGSAALMVAAKYALLAAPAYALLAPPGPLFLSAGAYFAFGIVLFQRRVGLSTPLECTVLILLFGGMHGHRELAIRYLWAARSRCSLDH